MMRGTMPTWAWLAIASFPSRAAMYRQTVDFPAPRTTEKYLCPPG